MIRIFSIALLLCSTTFVQAENNAGQPKGCARSVLQATVDRYIEAQKAGSLSKAPLAAR
jgi:hypothetical protein